MSAAEFEEWKHKSTETFAQEMAQASGQPIEATREQARQQFPALLPQGLDTAGHRLDVVIDSDGSDVGLLWIGPHPDRPGAAYVYEIEISAGHRGRGLGRAAMVAAEGLAREAGTQEIGLQVFGPNERARRLYDSLGYRVVATRMTKKLTD